MPVAGMLVYISTTRPPLAREPRGESRRRLRSHATECNASTPLGCSGRRRSVARWTSLLGCSKMCRPSRRTPSLGGRGGRRSRRRVYLARPAIYGLAWRGGRRRGSGSIVSRSCRIAASSGPCRSVRFRLVSMLSYGGLRGTAVSLCSRSSSSSTPPLGGGASPSPLSTEFRF